jgi:hypothetical protein
MASPIPLCSRVLGVLVVLVATLVGGLATPDDALGAPPEHEPIYSYDPTFSLTSPTYTFNGRGPPSPGVLANVPAVERAVDPWAHGAPARPAYAYDTSVQFVSVARGKPQGVMAAAMTEGRVEESDPADSSLVTFVVAAKGAGEVAEGVSSLSELHREAQRRDGHRA